MSNEPTVHEILITAKQFRELARGKSVRIKLPSFDCEIALRPEALKSTKKTVKTIDVIPIVDASNDPAESRDLVELDNGHRVTTPRHMDAFLLKLTANREAGASRDVARQYEMRRVGPDGKWVYEEAH